MPNRIVPNNWREFQHYKDRCPPWIRLHRKLLDNKDFQRLPDASRALAPMLWLLASESLDGTINADADDLSFRLRQSEEWVVEALKPLISKGFFIVHEADASALLAPRLQPAVPEALQSRGITEAEADPPAAAPAPKQKRKSPQTPIPDDFGVSERVSKWAAAKGYGNLPEHLDAFKRKCVAKGYTNASWDDAFMEAIREDWAKLRGGQRGVAPPPEATNRAAEETAQRLAEERSREITRPPAEILERLNAAVRRVA